MKTLFQRLPVVIVALLLISTSSAQVPEQLRECVEIEVAIERLSCFDREMMNLTSEAAPEAASTASDQHISTATAVSQIAREPVVAARPVASPPTDAASAAETVPAASSGGRTVSTVARSSQPTEEGQKRDALEATVEEFNSEPEPRAEPLREITAVVTGITNRVRGEHVIELENGQTWQENFASRYMPLEPGDEVTIRKRRFGGYRLVTPSGKGYRVKRVR